MKSLILVCSLVVALVSVSACDKFKGPASPDGGPVINAFSASSSSVKVNTPVTFTWEALAGDTARIDPEPGSVALAGARAVTVKALGLNVYTLTVSKQGFVPAVSTVTVVGVP